MMNSVTVTSHVNFARGEIKHASSARPCLLLCPGFARQECDALPAESPVQQISIAFALRRVYDCVLLGGRNNKMRECTIYVSFFFFTCNQNIANIFYPNCKRWRNNYKKNPIQCRYLTRAQ